MAARPLWPTLGRPDLDSHLAADPTASVPSAYCGVPASFGLRSRPPRPWLHVPLFPALEANPEMGLLPPRVLYACPGHHIIFFVNTVPPGWDSPPRDDARPKKIFNRF